MTIDKTSWGRRLAALAPLRDEAHRALDQLGLWGPLAQAHHRAQTMTVTAGQRSSGLPIEKDLYWRFHHPAVPLDAEHAWARHWGTTPGPENDHRGFAAFNHPRDLHQYLHDMDWTSEGGRDEVDFDERKIVGFPGKHVGHGIDGEDLVIPTGSPKHEMSYEEFARRISHTPTEGTRWDLSQAHYGQKTAGRTDHAFGYEHGLIGAPGNKPISERGVAKHGPEYLDEDDHDYLRGHAEGTTERERRQSERAANGQHECPDCRGSGLGSWKGQSCKGCDGSGALSEQEAHKTNVLYHVTDNPHFKPDPSHVPIDNALAISSRDRPGLFAARGQDVSHWTHGQQYVRPYVAELHVPRIAHEPGRWGGERFIPAENFDQVKVNRIIPLAAHEKEQYGGKRYRGPDARDMTPQQHAQHKEHALNELRTQHGFEDEDIEHLRQHWARLARALPKQQKCRYCSAQATQRVIHSEGMAYLPCCDEHLGKAKDDAARCTPDGSYDESNVDAVRKIVGEIGFPESLMHHEIERHVPGYPTSKTIENDPLMRNQAFALDHHYSLSKLDGWEKGMHWTEHAREDPENADRYERTYEEVGRGTSRPIVVHEHTDEDTGEDYGEILDGTHRVQYALHQGKTHHPAYVHHDEMRDMWGHREAAGIPPAERTESVKHMLDRYVPTDFDTWDQVRANTDWNHPKIRAFVDDVRRNGVKRPIPVDYESDPPRVMNGHTRLLAAEKAGQKHVPTRQHQGWLDPDDPDHLGRGPDDPEHWSNKLAMGQAGPDYDNLSFHNMTGFEYGAPPDIHHHELLFARHPEHGYLGHIQYVRNPDQIDIQNMQVHREYQRRGVASQLMAELERRNPDTVINHGNRTSEGGEWARHFYGDPGESLGTPGGMLTYRAPPTRGGKPVVSGLVDVGAG